MKKLKIKVITKSPSEEKRFKIGSYVQIIARLNGHQHDIGEIVKIKNCQELEKSRWILLSENNWSFCDEECIPYCK